MSTNLSDASRLLSPIIDDMEAQLLEAVQQSIRIESVRGTPSQSMPFGEGPAKALQHALKIGASLGFRTENIRNAVGFAEYGQGEEMIAVLGHLDVVPAGEGWLHPPFGGQLEHGCLWGRGALDDKGPSIGALFALKAIQKSGLPLKRRVRVILGTNEETGSKDMPYYNQSQEAPAAGFTPDASYPVIFAEKGILTFSLSKTVPQYGGAMLSFLSGGTASNVVPAAAKAVISFADGTERQYETVGISAHGSMPELGKNAIMELLGELAQFDFSPELKEYLSFMNGKIGMETDGTSLGIKMQDTPSGSLTLNLAMISLNVCDAPCPVSGEFASEFSAVINIRYPVTKSASDILEFLTCLASESGLTLTIMGHKEPLYIDENSSFIRNLLNVYEEFTGESAKPVSIGGGTYAKSMKNIAAFGPLFPGQEDVSHQPEEHISIENLMRNIKMIASAMYVLANEA